MSAPKASRLKTAIFYTVAWFAKQAYQGYFRTIHLQVENRIYEHRFSKTRSVVYACWHSKTFLLLPYFKGGSVAVLTLLDWRNFFYDKLCRLYGCQTVPTLDPASATLRLVRYLRGGSSVLLAVDGPIGPRGKIRPGAAFLASATRRPLVTVRVIMDKSFRLKGRWDHYEVPFPFSKVTLVFHEPFSVTSDNVAAVDGILAEQLGEP